MRRGGLAELFVVGRSTVCRVIERVDRRRNDSIADRSTALGAC
jgi:hypothetical protein